MLRGVSEKSQVDIHIQPWKEMNQQENIESLFSTSVDAGTSSK